MRTRCERSAVHARGRSRIALGPLETRVMEVLWRFPQCTVHQMRKKLPPKRAYNTVMTTLVRLFKKGLLSRRKQGHRFVYSPQVSAEDWGRLVASEFVDNFAAIPNVTHRLLVSYLLEALSELDPKLPAEMEAQIVDKRGARARFR